MPVLAAARVQAPAAADLALAEEVGEPAEKATDRAVIGLVLGAVDTARARVLAVDRVAAAAPALVLAAAQVVGGRVPARVQAPAAADLVFTQARGPAEWSKWGTVTVVEAMAQWPNPAVRLLFPKHMQAGVRERKARKTRPEA